MEFKHTHPKVFHGLELDTRDDDGWRWFPRFVPALDYVPDGMPQDCGSHILFRMLEIASALYHRDPDMPAKQIDWFERAAGHDMVNHDLSPEEVWHWHHGVTVAMRWLHNKHPELDGDEKARNLLAWCAMSEATTLHNHKITDDAKYTAQLLACEAAKHW